MKTPMMQYCLYAHRKASNGEVFYIGQARVRDKDKKFVRPFNRTSRSKFWKRIVKKHGRTVEILAYVPTREIASALEIRLIAHYGKRIDGGVLCNLTDGGEGNSGAPLSKESRAKMSAAASSRRHSLESRAKMSAAVRLRGAEWRANMSAAQQARPPVSVDTRARMSAAQRARGPVSAETRAKMSAAKKGRKLTMAHRANIGASQKGQPGKAHSDETKAKISAAKKGHKLGKQSADHVAKKRNSQNRTFAKRRLNKLAEAYKRVCLGELATAYTGVLSR